MKIQAIVPAAGLGKRFNKKVPKALSLLQGKPVIAHTLAAFEKNVLIESLILVVPAQYLYRFKQVVEQYQFHKVKKIIAGGRNRSDSVKGGLKAIDEDTAMIVVHDGVRPLLTKDVLNQAIELCRRWKAVAAAVPVKSTIKRINKKTFAVQETLNRDELWEIQTPQVFKKEILCKAYERIKGVNPTDDAMLVERLGCKVRIFFSDYKNIKITTPEDLKIARVFLGTRR